MGRGVMTFAPKPHNLVTDTLLICVEVYTLAQATESTAGKRYAGWGDRETRGWGFGIPSG